MRISEDEFDRIATEIERQRPALLQKTEQLLEQRAAAEHTGRRSERLLEVRESLDRALAEIDGDLIRLRRCLREHVREYMDKARHA